MLKNVASVNVTTTPDMAGAPLVPMIEALMVTLMGRPVDQWLQDYYAERLNFQPGSRSGEIGCLTWISPILIYKPATARNAGRKYFLDRLAFARIEKW